VGADVAILRQSGWGENPGNRKGKRRPMFTRGKTNRGRYPNHRKLLGDKPKIATIKRIYIALGVDRNVKQHGEPLTAKVGGGMGFLACTGPPCTSYIPGGGGGKSKYFNSHSHSKEGKTRYVKEKKNTETQHPRKRRQFSFPVA